MIKKKLKAKKKKNKNGLERKSKFPSLKTAIVAGFLTYNYRNTQQA